ncbi:S8 family peptidase [Aquabacterium humicola]|uniref:S8 family peptidase n=1 Tax=Aquabacterium humicola TaxID=3237377 RepID=UPI0025439B68|nr:S8 family serine peptidase [Rubrivivax pictus]
MRLARIATARVALFLFTALCSLATVAAEHNPARRAPGAAEQAAADARADALEGPRVIVKLRPASTAMRALGAAPRRPPGPQAAATLSLRTGLALTDGRVIDARMQALRGAPGLSSAALAARLAADPDVEYAVPDRRRFPLALPNDPLFAAQPSISPAAGQWYLQAPDATLVSAINAVGAWQYSTGSPSIVVADIDTGVLPWHPDLAGKLLPGYDFISSLSMARDGNTRDDDPADPGDWVAQDDCGPGSGADSSSWHGTQTSALIGALTDNGIGMASVGRDVMLLPVRVLGKCGGRDSDIIAGMLWAAGLSNEPKANPHPARVLNLSLGSYGFCDPAYADAVSRITAAGVVVVAAAGNDEGLAVGAPANCPGAIAVAGVRHAGTKVGFSSMGPQVAIAAPAGNCVNPDGPCLYPILTATNAGTTVPTTHGYSDGVHFSVGTSFAAPLVSGTAALILSVNPSLSPAQVRTLLQHRARPFPTTSDDDSVAQCKAPGGVPQGECLCTTSTCGAGLLDAGGAVAAASGSTGPIAAIDASATTVLYGNAMTLDAGASVVGGGRRIAAYQWAITSGSDVVRIDGAGTEGRIRLVTIGLGSATIRLTITDDLGQQATSSVALTVKPPPGPTARIQALTGTVSPGSTMTLDGSGSIAATNLTITAYKWEIVLGATRASIVGSATSPSVAIVTSGAGSATFTVKLTVTDTLGRQANATRPLAISTSGPTASFSPATAAAAIGDTLRFDSTSTAQSGRSIRSQQWALLDGNGGVAAISGGTTDAALFVKALAAGSFTLQLTVIDSGNIAATQRASFTVRGRDADRVFDWAESLYPQWFPKPGSAGTQAPYSYRYYASTGVYLGTANGRVVVHDGRDWNMLDVGALADFLQQAAAAGF